MFILNLKKKNKLGKPTYSSLWGQNPKLASPGLILIHVLLSINGGAGARDCFSTHDDRFAVVIYTLSPVPRTGQENTFDRTGQVRVHVETRKERKTNQTIQRLTLWPFSSRPLDSDFPLHHMATLCGWQSI